MKGTSMSDSRPEVWLRGPVEGVPALLQPVAHALLQAVEEIEELVRDLPDELLWTRPGGLASAGFHLRHIPGVIDRLFTYARGEALNPSQRTYLAHEGTPGSPPPGPAELMGALRRQVDAALEQLRDTDERTLAEPRFVGRARLPSTVTGLLFHAAEHTQRHAGQLRVTLGVQRSGT
jgi:uncharacterized damage-inducible protein DinB